MLKQFVNLNKWFRLPRPVVNDTVTIHKRGGPMKRVLSLAILIHWMMFFLLHALGALAGSLEFGLTGPVRPAFSLFEAHGPMRAMPMVGSGMGMVSLLAAMLFAWAVLVCLVQSSEADDGEIDVERTSFACATIVFSMLMLIAIVRADPDMLASATIYFGAVLVSWAVVVVEWELVSLRASKRNEAKAAQLARAMAGEAAWQTNLNRISGRKGTH